MDEADTMLDESFFPVLETLLEQIKRIGKKVQYVVATATVTQNLIHSINSLFPVFLLFSVLLVCCLGTEAIAVYCVGVDDKC